MAKKKLLVHLDLNQNELQNVILQPLAVAPTAPVKEGHIYYNSADDTVYVNTSATPASPVWLDLGNQGSAYSHTTGLTANPDLSGANVLASFTTNDEGHVTAVTTRALTLSDLGYTPYSHPAGATSIDTTGVEVVDTLVFDTEGHVTGVTTRTLTAAELAAVIINDGAASGATQTWSIDKIVAEIDAAVAAGVAGGMTYKGGYDALNDTPTLEADGTGVSIGDTYTVTTAGGTFFGDELAIGDVLIAEVDNPAVKSDWTVVNKNIPDIVSASETAEGLIELATQAEVDAGIDAVRAVTPATLENKLDEVRLTFTSDDASVVIDDTTTPGTIDFSVPTTSDRFGVTGEDDTATANRRFNYDSYTVLFDSDNATWDSKASFSDSSIVLQTSNVTNDRHSFFFLAETALGLDWWDADNTHYGISMDSFGIVISNKYQSIQVPINVGGTLPMSVNGNFADATGDITVSLPTYSTATTEAEGLIELATQAEVDAGTDAVRAVTPATLKTKLDNYVSDVASADSSVTVTNDGNGNYDLSVATSFAQKHTAVIGDGVATSIPITHNLGSTFVMVQMREVSSNIMVECQVTYTDVNTVTLVFNDAPASNDIEVTIIG